MRKLAGNMANMLCGGYDGSRVYWDMYISSYWTYKQGIILVIDNCIRCMQQ